MPPPVTVIKEKVRRLSRGPGVYLMKDRLGTVIYVGKAKNLHKRVSTYFQPSRRFALAQPKVVAMLDLIHDFDIVEVRSEAEALLLEGRLIKEYRPRYNTDFTDNKQFLLVRVDAGAGLPRFRLTRNRREDGARYYGPFAQAGLLRETLRDLRSRFGILLHEASPRKLPDGRWLLYDDARAEIYGQTEPVSEEAYRERVALACEFLEGKAREWAEQLKEEMQAAAQRRDFERAAVLRDRIQALEKTLQPARRFHGRGDPLKALGITPSQPTEALEELKQVLGLRRLPRTMECFDISHISGSHAVASMVHFAQGRPQRNQYRRYRIKSFVGNDDFRAMAEVVGRRYSRLHREGQAMPELVVIDGGLGQVNAALAAFALHELEQPPLIGLAKREETIIFGDGREPLNLPRQSLGLRLLQHLRDEAHRFANSFNHALRRERIRETVLLDMPGLGERKRAALMAHFKSMAKLRAASVEAIAEVEGFGCKMAERLHAFLHQDEG